MKVNANQATSVSDSLMSLDIKCTLVGAGVRYPKEIYDAVAGWARLEPPSNAYACNCLILPGEVAVHLHANENSRFGLQLENGRPMLVENKTPLVEVTFPAERGYNHQKTTAGHSFGSIAVLEGRSTLAFFYLWSCDYVKTRETCSFCFQVMAEMAGYDLPSPSNAEVAEIIRWAIENAGVEEVQLTAGTLFGSRTECRRYAELLRTVDEAVGLHKLKSEVYCYLTAPNDPSEVDQMFEAGADRVAFDLHVWNPQLQARFAPGHARYVTRTRQLRALEYVAEKYGPNRAFSAFVAGLEPLDDMLAGAEYLARRGIVPAFSVWMPTPGSVSGDLKPPGLDYYRQARREFARLYQTYNLNPPGVAAGSHVSLCRDIYRHRDAILAE
jgi:hypothetical protein